MSKALAEVVPTGSQSTAAPRQEMWCFMRHTSPTDEHLNPNANTKWQTLLIKTQICSLPQGLFHFWWMNVQLTITCCHLNMREADKLQLKDTVFYKCHGIGTCTDKERYVKRGSNEQKTCFGLDWSINNALNLQFSYEFIQPSGYNDQNVFIKSLWKTIYF